MVIKLFLDPIATGLLFTVTSPTKSDRHPQKCGIYPLVRIRNASSQCYSVLTPCNSPEVSGQAVVKSTISQYPEYFLKVILFFLQGENRKVVAHSKCKYYRTDILIAGCFKYKIIPFVSSDGHQTGQRFKQ